MRRSSGGSPITKRIGSATAGRRPEVEDPGRDRCQQAQRCRERPTPALAALAARRRRAPALRPASRPRRSTAARRATSCARLPAVVRVLGEAGPHDPRRAPAAPSAGWQRGRTRLLAHDRRRSRLAWLLPSNALRPVDHLVEHARRRRRCRVRASASRPSSCSGAMYWNVPRIVPALGQRRSGQRRRAPTARTAACRVPSCLASPKSSSLAPALREHDVAGLQVAVDDALPVRLVERVGDLDRVAQAPGRSAAALAPAGRPASRPRGTP